MATTVSFASRRPTWFVSQNGSQGPYDDRRNVSSFCYRSHVMGNAQSASAALVHFLYQHTIRRRSLSMLASHNDVASSQARTCDRLWPTPHVEDTTNRGCSQDRKDGREYHTAQSAVDYMITNVSISIVQYTEAFAD
jgi:hypothetical protein